MSNETLLLMLEGEHRDTSWVDVLACEKEDPFEEFGLNAKTVVECVTMQIDFDENVLGEIDRVEQFHYLRGPNAYDEDELEMMGHTPVTEAFDQ